MRLGRKLHAPRVKPRRTQFWRRRQLPGLAQIGRLKGGGRQDWRPTLEHAAFEAGDGEGGGIGDGHDGHDAGLTGSETTRSGGIGDATGHVEADDEGGLRATSRTARSICRRPRVIRPGRGRVLWEGGRRREQLRREACPPTRGMVSTEICSPRMLWRSASGDCADGDLAHPRAATDDNDAFAVDLLERLDAADFAAKDGQGGHVVDEDGSGLFQ